MAGAIPGAIGAGLLGGGASALSSALIGPLIKNAIGGTNQGVNPKPAGPEASTGGFSSLMGMPPGIGNMPSNNPMTLDLAPDFAGPGQNSGPVNAGNLNMGDAMTPGQSKDMGFMANVMRRSTNNPQYIPGQFGGWYR